MLYETQKAMGAFDAEVDRIAAGMIENGVPPIDAIQRATQVVCRRRRNAARMGAKEVADLLKGPSDAADRW